MQEKARAAGEEQGSAMKAMEEMEARAREAQEATRRREEERQMTLVKGKRWEFRFRDVSAEGKGGGVVGTRYGVPSQDRKKGKVKIPIEVR